MVTLALLNRTPKTTPSTRKVKDTRVEALTRFAISITVFNVVGRLLLGFETSWAALTVTVATAYSTELLLEYVDARANGRRPRFAGGLKQLVIFLLPPHIGAFAISMLIYPGQDLWPFCFAAVVATGGKYLIQVPIAGKMRHVFNPSALGISATLLLFPWVGVGLPYQFTETVPGWLAWVIPLAVFASGLMLNWKLTGKMPLVLSWIGFFVVQALLRGLDPTISTRGALAPMTGLAFLLFTTYMITDPSTSPARPRNQVIFGAACAGGYAAFMLAHQVYGIFYSLVIVCAIRGAYHWLAYCQTRRRPAAQSPAPTPSAEQPAVARPARPEAVGAERE
jgi:hypothetical protein